MYIYNIFFFHSVPRHFCRDPPTGPRCALTAPPLLLLIPPSAPGRGHLALTLRSRRAGPEPPPVPPEPPPRLPPGPSPRRPPPHRAAGPAPTHPQAGGQQAVRRHLVRSAGPPRPGTASPAATGGREGGRGEGRSRAGPRRALRLPQRAQDPAARLSGAGRRRRHGQAPPGPHLLPQAGGSR